MLTSPLPVFLITAWLFVPAESRHVSALPSVVAEDELRKPVTAAGAAPRPIESTGSGLSSHQTSTRLAGYGRNEPAATREPAWRALLLVLGDPFLLLLIVASGVSAMVGNTADALLILTMGAVSGALSFTQSYRSQRTSDRLPENVVMTASVQEDEVGQTGPRNDIVPGEIIRLAAGDLIPADAQRLAPRDLHVHDAVLTGESLPAEEDSSPAPAPDDERHLLFMRIPVVSSAAEAVVPDRRTDAVR
jgi:Mg2+-importing ATPase